MTFLPSRLELGTEHLRLVHPLGALLRGGSSRAEIEVRGPLPERCEFLRSRWLTRTGEELKSGGSRRPLGALSASQSGYFGLKLLAPEAEGEYRLEIALTNSEGTPCPGFDPLSVPVLVVGGTARASVSEGVQPLSYAWGTDRGLPVHRYYLEQFLNSHRADVKGNCLEFQDPLYSPRFGGENIDKLDILHIDDRNPHATLVADLTAPNDLPTEAFDCIVCTHVLHVIYEVEKVIGELHRILRPDGVLLVAVPHTSMQDPREGELWRFTPEGLRRALASVFAPNAITVHAYGNSLTAAGDLRGVVASEFEEDELNAHDPWFPVEVCARATKTGTRR
jgi:SAM-dependent methyltransferase